MADVKTKRISLAEKVKSLMMLNLVFIGVAVKKAADGKRIAILQLADPIALVRGSQDVQVNGAMHGVVARDVTEVQVYEEDFEKYPGFYWDEETNTGGYEGDQLILDVAKRTQQVWLRSTSFAASGTEYRNSAQNERYAKMIFGNKDTADKAATATGAKDGLVVTP